MTLTITKKISKQRPNLIIVIPKNLHPFLKAGELVQISIDKMSEFSIQSRTYVAPPSSRNEKILSTKNHQEPVQPSDIPKKLSSLSGSLVEEKKNE